jgi:hypothetical protein
MSEINKFKELLHQHTQVSFSCGEHHVPWEYAKFEARQRETKRALVEWVEKREARIAELEAKMTGLAEGCCPDCRRRQASRLVGE